jgi:RNase P subunit RPR2
MTLCPICKNISVAIEHRDMTNIEKECTNCGWVSRYSQDQTGKGTYSEHYGNIQFANH